jgi:hypothetical protein
MSIDAGAAASGGGQWIAQDPGPSGCPQLPQGPIAAIGAASAPGAAVANTDSFFANCVDAQFGQCGTVEARTSVSNSRPQS